MLAALPKPLLRPRQSAERVWDRHGGHGDDERWLVQVQLMIAVLCG